MTKIYHSEVNDTIIELLKDGGAIVYKRVGNPTPPESDEKEEDDPVAKKTRRVKQPKAAYGDKTREIEICVREGRSVKETITHLKAKFPTITPSDVYQVRTKINKSSTSDSFTGPVKMEEDSQADMEHKYGKTAVQKVIDLSHDGYKIDAIAHHHEVRLTGEEVDEIVTKCA